MKQLFAAAVLCIAAALPGFPRAETIHPKVVIIGYFESSKAYGEKGYWGEADRPGELYKWIEGFKLTRRLDVRGAFTRVWANADGSVIAMKVGPNSINPAVNVTALGLDDRFDLSHAFWLVNGIAGASPVTGTIGDVALTDFIVNGGVAHQIDSREIPPDWPEGYFPAGSTHPYPQPRVEAGSPEDVRTWAGSFHTNRAHTVTMLNAGLLHWAYQLTADVPLADNADMKTVRDEYDEPAARRAPKVVIGSTLSSETFWLGGRLDAWARHWVSYMTDGRGTFASTETNDSGTMVALTALADAGRIDPNRVLLMRGASNFDMPPHNIPAAQQLVRQGPQSYAGYLPALDNLYATGSVIINAILEHWNRFEVAPPSD